MQISQLNQLKGISCNNPDSSVSNVNDNDVVKEVKEPNYIDSEQKLI